LDDFGAFFDDQEGCFRVHAVENVSDCMEIIS
jgi:hypothetical protein